MPVSLYNDERLVYGTHTLSYYKGPSLVRNFVFDASSDPIVSCHVVTFRNKPAVVVVMPNKAHVYYAEHEHIVCSFPFDTGRCLAFENGLVLEKKGNSTRQLQNEPKSAGSEISTATSLLAPANGNIVGQNFFSLLDPMSEVGLIVSSSTSSFSASEEMVWFPQNTSCTLAVTFNSANGIISVYHVRFLSHKSLPQRKSSVRRKSYSRKSSIPGTLEDKGETSIRRSLSHSEMLSYDRMAAVGGDLETETSNLSIKAESSILRKEIVLTKVEKVQFSGSSRDCLKVYGLRFMDSQGVVIVNKESQNTEVLIFKTFENSVNLPRYETSYSFRSVDSVALRMKNHDGYLVSLTETGSLLLVNPFLQLTSESIEGYDGVLPQFSELVDCCNGVLAGTVSQSTVFTDLLLEPMDLLTKQCIESLKYVFGPYISEFFWLKWVHALSLTQNDWDSFMATVLAIIMPQSSSSEAQNRVAAQLSNAAILKEKGSRLHAKHDLSTFSPNIFLGLHLLREEYRLNVLDQQHVNQLGEFLQQLASWMGWSENWINYYAIENKNNVDKTTLFRTMEPLADPPNILRSLCSIFSEEIVLYVTFSQLCEHSESVDVLVTPRSFYILRIFEAIVSSQFGDEDVVRLMVEYGINRFALETYPIGIKLPLKEYVLFCKQRANWDDSIEFFELLGRKDLEKLNDNTGKSFHFAGFEQATVGNKDINSLVQSLKKDDPLGAWDGQTEAYKLSITKLLFCEDRRYYEATKLLQTSKIECVTLEPSPEMNEYDLLKLQKQLSLVVSLKTLTIPLGRGALFFANRVPILTEKYPIPKLNFDTLIVPSNTTLSFDKELVRDSVMDWGYFHNGVSAGMSISKSAKSITGSWIVFNRPSVLNAQHGGFLFGLGLNGHLRNLEEWNIYNYLGPKHTHTSVGLLLGMSASALGSMDMKLTKVLSVHVVALLPQGSTDLNVPLLVQTAGLIGIGLLYLETQHRRMSEILLSQISKRIPLNDNLIVDEGYRLAAGIALGYVNLGKGDDLRGLNDTYITDKLVSMAISLKDVQTSQEFDKSAPGAILALALIYMRTNNTNIAIKLGVPQTQKLLEYVRPDLLLLRIVAKNLILWDSVSYEDRWIRSQIPQCLQKRIEASFTEVALDSDNLPFFNCLGGACLSVGIKYVSSGNLAARDTLLHYLDRLMVITKSEATNFDERIAQSCIATIQDVVAISVALIMAGTGDLQTMRRLRILHNRTCQGVMYSSYVSSSMALGFLFLGSGEYAFDDSNFAIAALLTAIYPVQVSLDDVCSSAGVALGVGGVTGNGAIGAAGGAAGTGSAASGGAGVNYGESGSESYLQALRHFWALSVRPRCLVVRDIKDSKPVSIEIELQMHNGGTRHLKAPCLLPKLSEISYIQTKSSKYYNIKVDFATASQEFLKNLTSYVSEKEEGPGESLFAGFESDKDSIDLGFEELFGQGSQQPVTSVKNEVFSSIGRMESVDDLWSEKLLLAFYDKLSGTGEYMNDQDVDQAKLQLWRSYKSLQ